MDHPKTHIMEPQGKRLLASTVDTFAESDPERLFAIIPRGTELTDGFRHVSMQALAHAVNGMCWWIERCLGKSPGNKPVAFIGSDDIRYCIFTLSCHKTGYMPVLPSTRNSTTVHLHLLEKLGCNNLVYSASQEQCALELQTHCSELHAVQMPSVETLLTQNDGKHAYAFVHSYAELEKQPACIIHSSGTTGMPKPVFLAHGFFAAMDAWDELGWPADCEVNIFYRVHQPVLSTTPFYHILGLASIIFAIFHGTPLMHGPEKPLSLELLVGLIAKAHPAAVALPPSILEEICQSEKALACLKQLRSVYFGGAPLSAGIAALAQKYTQVIPIIGSSEIGWLPSMAPADPADWSYFQWHPSSGIVMEDVGSGLSELTIHRNHDLPGSQGIFYTFPELDVYRTNDLYTQHPTKPQLWKFCCRQDDLILLSNGEKVDPVNMEKVIENHPFVARAVIIGQSKFQTGLLVEPSSDARDIDPTVLIDAIWSTVQKANSSVAAYGRIMRSMVRVASEAKPFKRTPKGTVQKRATLTDYEAEIDEMYRAEGYMYPVPENITDLAVMAKYVRQLIVQVLGSSDFEDTQDLYGLGLDSLMTVHLARVLQKSLQERRPDMPAIAVSPQDIYVNPTVETLATFGIGVLQGRSNLETIRAHTLSQLVEDYTANLPLRDTKPSQWSKCLRSSVILTGSTGSLGTYLLSDLLRSPWVDKIYCLNRSHDAESRQKNSFWDKGLSVDVERWVSKLQFFQVSLGEERFGLGQSTYDELLGSVDTIIHNAWKVDFNLSVKSFEKTHIWGVRRLVEFSLASSRTAHVHFISSLGTVGKWNIERGALIPEEPIKDYSVVLPQGYAESKYVSEQICHEAARLSKVPTTIHRVGQLGGPTTSRGKWNEAEWLPTLICTSKAMGQVPDGLGSMAIDWVPVDQASQIIVELVHGRQETQFREMCAVYHLRNPEVTQWPSLVPVVEEVYGIPRVPLDTWVSALDAIKAPTVEEVERMPALKLLTFFRRLCDKPDSSDSPLLGIEKTMAASSSMRSLRPISASLLQNWVGQWDF